MHCVPEDDTIFPNGQVRHSNPTTSNRRLASVQGKFTVIALLAFTDSRTHATTTKTKNVKASRRIVCNESRFQFSDVLFWCLSFFLSCIHCMSFYRGVTATTASFARQQRISIIISLPTTTLPSSSAPLLYFSLDQLNFELRKILPLGAARA